MRDRIHLEADIEGECTGRSQQCPPPTVKIEKVGGSLNLFGVSIGNNCQISLPAFGLLFIFIGIILTIVAFKAPDNRFTTGRQGREDPSSNIKILGPVCIVVGLVMVSCALILKYFATKSVDKHTRVGFYCPVHGDFYPLSPGINPRKYSFSDLTQDHKWWLPTSCLKKKENADSIIPDIPTCPHSISPSNRSSFDGQHILISNPNPSTVIITTTNTAKEERKSNEQTQPSSSRSTLSVFNDDVGSFPSYRSRSNPPTSPPTPEPTTSFPTKRASCPTLPDIGTLSQLQIEKLSTLSPWVVPMPVKTTLRVVKPTDSIEYLPHHASNSSVNSDEETKKRKSVSILLPLKR